MAAVYLTTNDFKDPDIKAIIAADVTASASSDDFIELAEAYFLQMVSDLGGTAPDAGSETYDQKRLMVLYASELACEAYAGLDYGEVQEGVPDKYAYKMRDFYKRRTGKDYDTGASVGMGLEEKVRQQLVASTDPNVPTLDWSY